MLIFTREVLKKKKRIIYNKIDLQIITIHYLKWFIDES